MILLYMVIKYLRIIIPFLFFLSLLSCRYDPKYISSVEESYFIYKNRYLLHFKNFETFNGGFDNIIFDKYRVNNTIIHFNLTSFLTSISIDEGKNNNLSSLRWELEVFKRINSNTISYNVNKIMIKTSEYEVDLNELISNEEYYTKEQRKVDFNNRYWQDNNYLDSRILGSTIIISLPKDGKIDAILNIDLINDDGYENYEFIYSFKIKRKVSLWTMIM